MTDLRAAAQAALEALEHLDGLDTETECVTIDVSAEIAGLRAALAAAPAAYPLPDDLYAGSKDWAHGDYAQRVEWLHSMYESTKAERDMLLQQLAAPAAPAEPRLLVTDEQIDDKANAIDTEPAFCAGYFNGWREAEKHHGIGAAPAAGEGA